MSTSLSIADIVEFWGGRQSRTPAGRWCHDFDRQLLSGEIHEFNLDYPVSPFVGDILQAPTVILNLNGGFDPVLTPSEFAKSGAEDRWLSRVADPSAADWSDVSRYYDRANYGAKIRSGAIALINACAYRSPSLTSGLTRELAEKLPSVTFHRRWLREALIPECKAGRRVVLANRWGLWKVSKSAFPEIIFDPAPVSPNISAVSWERLSDKLSNLSL